MGYDAIKLELIEWLAKLDDNDTIEYLKIVKDSKSGDLDWWDDLSDVQKEGIERGLRDIESGKITSNEEVRLKYGL